MAFSIKNYRNTSYKLTIVDPVTKEALIDPDTNTPAVLDIVGIESAEFEDVKNEVQLKTLEIMKAHKKLSPEQHKQLTFELVAAYVTGWNETAEKLFKEELGDGKYSKASAMKLLSNNDYFWLVKQIESCVNDRTRFFTKQ